MSWEFTTLGEYFLKNKGLIQTGPFGSQLHQSDYKQEGIPVIMPKDILQNGVNTKTIARINEQDKNRLKKYIVKERDIIFPRRGEITKRAYITINEVGFLCGTGCILIRNTSTNLSSRFLNYFLSDKKTVDWLESNAVGSTMKNLSGAILKKLPISIPPISTQQKIASILSAYDDLIENNLKSIKLLEEAAQHIYKEWFVNFRFPGSENIPINKETRLPEGWTEEIVRNTLKKIKRPGKLKKSNYLENGNYPVIDQGSNQIGGYSNNVEIVISNPLPIVVFGDHTRRLKFIDFPFICGADGTQILYPKNKDLNPAFYFVAINNIDLSNYAYARHFKFLKEQKIIIPSAEILKLFNNISYPLLQQCTKLRGYNRKLKEARDFLLPRLMNRTLEV